MFHSWIGLKNTELNKIKHGHLIQAFLTSSNVKFIYLCKRKIAGTVSQS